MRILIIFGSTTGNNELMWEEIKSYLEEDEKNNIIIGSWALFKANDLKDYDMTFIWASTWWDGDIQDDMIELVEEIESSDLSGVKACVYANWMKEFPLFCEAGKKIKSALLKSGATIIWDTFEIDWDVYEKFEQLKIWVWENVGNLK